MKLKQVVIASWLLSLPMCLVHAGQRKSAETTEQLLAILIKHQALKLNTASEATGCESAWAGHHDVTLGDYMAHLAATLDSTNGGSGITSSCKEIGKEDSQQCDVMFRTGLGTEDPWAYGVRFTLKNGQLDPKSLICPGGS